MIRHCRHLPYGRCLPGLRPGRHMVVALHLALLATALPAGTYEVQRARKATAEVVRDGDDWVVSVEFVASHALGTAKDLLDNRRRARDYAKRGLFRELGGTAEDNMSVTALRIERSEEEDGRWKARFRIPANGIAMQPKSRSEPEPSPDSTDIDASAPPVRPPSGGDGIEAPSPSSPPVVEVPDIQTPSLPSPSLPSPPRLNVPEIKAPALPPPMSIPSPSALSNPIPATGMP